MPSRVYSLPPQIFEFYINETRKRVFHDPNLIIQPLLLEQPTLVKLLQDMGQTTHQPLVKIFYPFQPEDKIGAVKHWVWSDPSTDKPIIYNLTKWQGYTTMLEKIKIFSTVENGLQVVAGPIQGVTNDSAIVSNTHSPQAFSNWVTAIQTTPFDPTLHTNHPTLYHSAAINSLFYPTLTQLEFIHTNLPDSYTVLLNWFDSQNFCLETDEDYQRYIILRSIFNFLLDVATQNAHNIPNNANWEDILIIDDVHNRLKKELSSWNSFCIKYIK